MLTADTVDERGDVFSPPDSSAGAELDGPGITPGAAAFPPCAFTDGKMARISKGRRRKPDGDVGKHEKLFDTVTR